MPWHNFLPSESFAADVQYQWVWVLFACVGLCIAWQLINGQCIAVCCALYSLAAHQWTMHCWDMEQRITSFVQQSAACVRIFKTVQMLLANMNRCVLHSQILENVNCLRFVHLDFSCLVCHLFLSSIINTTGIPYHSFFAVNNVKHFWIIQFNSIFFNSGNMAHVERNNNHTEKQTVNQWRKWKKGNEKHKRTPLNYIKSHIPTK